METLPESRRACSKVPAILREGLGWPMARAAHALTGAHNQALAEHGLTLRTFAVLATIGEAAARSQLEIAQIVGLDKTTLVATIDDLERRGLVRRTADPQDRRARIVGITAEGRALLRESSETVRSTEARFFAGVPKDELARLKSALVSVIDDSSRCGEGSGSCV